MYRIVLALAYLISGVYGRRMQSLTEKSESSASARTREAASQRSARLRLASEPSAAFNPSVPKGRALGGDSSFVGARQVFPDVQAYGGQRVPAGMMIDTMSRLFPGQEQGLESELDDDEDEEYDDDHMHSVSRSLYNRLRGKTKSFKKPMDVVELYRVVRGADGIGVNNRTLHQVLKQLNKDGAWQIAKDLLCAVESEGAAGTPPVEYQRVKTFVHEEDSAGMMVDPTEGVSLDEMEGEWTEELIDPNAKKDEDISKEQDDEEDWKKSIPSNLVYINPDAKNPLPAVYLNPVGTHHYNLVLSACAKARRWQEALDMLRRMRIKNVAPDARTYSLVLGALEKEGRSKLAMNVLDDMFQEEGVLPNSASFANAIATCVKARERGRAMYFVHLAFDSGVRLERDFYSKAINVCKVEGDWTQAVLILQRMTFEHFTPSIAILNSVMAAFARAGEAAGCERFMREEFQNYGLEPDAISYNTLLSAFSHAHPPQVAELEEVMAEMEAMADTGTGKEFLRPNTFSYNHLIYGLGRAGRSEEAMDVLFLTMPKHEIEPTLISYTSVVDACNKTGDWEGAMSVMKKAEEANVTLNKIAYSKVIDATSMAGKWGKACNMLDEMSRKELMHPPFAVNNALTSCLDAGTEQAARRGLKSLKLVLRKYKQTVKAGLEGVDGVRIPNPACNFETTMIARKLMLAAGEAEADKVAELVSSVRDATVKKKKERLKLNFGRPLPERAHRKGQKAPKKISPKKKRVLIGDRRRQITRMRSESKEEAYA